MRRPLPAPWLIFLGALTTLAAGLGFGWASDNYVDNAYTMRGPGEVPRSVVFRSTEGPGGVHVPHVLLEGVPQVSTATIWSVQTSAADGAAFVPLPPIPCAQVRLVNLSGTAVEVRRGGAGSAMPVPDRASYVFRGVASAADLGVRRIDQAATSATLNGEAEK